MVAVRGQAFVGFENPKPNYVGELCPLTGLDAAGRLAKSIFHFWSAWILALPLDRSSWRRLPLVHLDKHRRHFMVFDFVFGVVSGSVGLRSANAHHALLNQNFSPSRARRTGRVHVPELDLRPVVFQIETGLASLHPAPR